MTLKTLRTLRKNNNMKKTYVSPLAMEVNVEAEAMIAASLS